MFAEVQCFILSCRTNSLVIRFKWRNMFLYILELCQGRWYVGTSKSPDERLKAHREGKGSPWTQLYKPIREHFRGKLSCSDEEARFEEDKKVKILMKDHGIDHVRGGAYSQIKLSDDQIINLQRELDHANNACLRCGRQGHFVDRCFARTDVEGNPLQQPSTAQSGWTEGIKASFPLKPGDYSDSEDSEDSEDFYLRTGMSPVRKGKGKGKGKGGKRNGPYETGACYRCGRPGHWESQCYARTHVNGSPLQ